MSWDTLPAVDVANFGLHKFSLTITHLADVYNRFSTGKIGINIVQLFELRKEVENIMSNYKLESKTVRKDNLPAAVDVAIGLMSLGFLDTGSYSKEYTVTNQRTGDSTTFDNKSDAMDYLDRKR